MDVFAALTPTYGAIWHVRRASVIHAYLDPNERQNIMVCTLGQLARLITRTLEVINGHFWNTDGVQAAALKGTGWLNLTPRANLPSGGEAPGDICVLDGTGAKGAGLYVLLATGGVAAWYRANVTAA